MTETVDAPAQRPAEQGGPGGTPPNRRLLLQVAIAVSCALLGFVLVAQVRATEGVGERLEAEREEDLARILSDLSAESDRLQTEITDLRLLLIEYETSQETEELTLRNLERRLTDLQVLAGVIPVGGEGLQFTIEDPLGHVGQDHLVDAVQELRDAGAEAIAVNGLRLIASSAFSTRNERLVLDGQPITPPYRITAVGPAETMAKALDIPGGAVQSVERAAPEVSTEVEQLAELTVPERAQPATFVYGEPVHGGGE